MAIDSTDNVELDKLLQEVKRTIKENRIFLETLKQEPLAEESGAEDQHTDCGRDESFEEL
ncbi:MAG: hypothetical protein PHP95_13950 [Desulfuromonadaceae bacterium]|nr:hypothetical protein [Desulfuromonadaceae bacterium]MDD2849552.1 hypothetical protein [Desulfuromonadaceae bacterium]MDD4131978.1 hypothetical protein [Desulfuromonadaceae bacterium]